MIIGSARIDERGQLSGGKSGDQKQKSTQDYAGEVSLQYFYVHKKGWYVLRPKDPETGKKIGSAMMEACNNANIGYDQGNRLDIIKKGIKTQSKAECDCSSLVRACILEATGKDVGNFTTANECAILGASGLFEAKKEYKNGMGLAVGDVLVTKSKGHTVVVVDSAYVVEPKESKFYAKYTGTSNSLVDALISMKINATKENRKRIAEANGVRDYSGTANQNVFLLSLLKKGQLKRP